VAVPAVQVTLPEATPEYPPLGLQVMLALGAALPCADKVIASDGEFPKSVRKEAVHTAAKRLDRRTILLSLHWGRHKLR